MLLPLGAFVSASSADEVRIGTNPFSFSTLYKSLFSFPQKMIGLADIAAPKIFVRDSKWIISNSSIFLFISRVVECYISSIQTEFWKASDTSMLHVASQKDLSFSMSAMEPTIQDWLHPVRVLHAPHPMSAFSAQ